MYLQKTCVSKKKFKDYRRFLTEKEFNKIQTSAKQLKGKKIIHLNSTPRGGGVAEILKSLVPIEQSLGLKSVWHCIKADTAFFHITKKIHNGLQGEKVFISDEQKKCYLDFNEKFAMELKKLNADLVIIHDPQPLAIARFYYSAPIILRAHPDLSAPDKETLNFLMPFIKNCQAAIFTLPQYAPKFLQRRRQATCIPKIYISQPAIDPLEEKNAIIEYSKCKRFLAKIGVNPAYPLIAQISRFDSWKNPLGVIEAFYSAKKEIPELQLILSGIIEAKDDPTACEILQDVKKYAKRSKDIYVFAELGQLKKLGVSHANFIKILQNCANPILQLSKREGFGLTVTEAMWRGKTVIGGDADGIKYQIQNGKNGFITSSPDEAAKKIIKIIKNPALARNIGKNARETVRKNFLITKLLADHLEIYGAVSSIKPPSP